ncbi:DUF3054 domain-containing protein [Corynebacterium uberis]|uniref:DUF3054 domain-containing protein n=1 Tax=Corynebacterium TaxID=1716 RepID=UPI001D0B727C|nr:MULTISPECIES: DUF3054 domain-containing protein [Corynebacterium]MCZ9309612.1 DUF3054 domain-containing protein [Corynebacterium sp. c6VSa_13]UDL73419.1 DUF3054 domain-containing protein [Corynebacterium uberis]UDL75701.1 DUF3054 domain-containing protein [Corynebacterium uberis]UDL77914.1 DUF3054 domain-containing protein [Corynebacterium uberis]UDL80197.1 DUF3054 domain-containing protein [Corynebacterium uberis]
MNTRHLRALVGDTTAIAAFALFARIAHRGPDMPLTFGGWVSTVWPFLLGIALTWGFVSWKGWDAWRIRPAGLTIWIGTVITGLIIWGIKHSAMPHWSFMIVASSTSALLLLGWRALARKRG